MYYPYPSYSLSSGRVVYFLGQDPSDVLKRFDPCCLLTPPPPPLFPPPPGVWKREPVSNIMLVYIFLAPRYDSMTVYCFLRPRLILW